VQEQMTLPTGARVHNHLALPHVYHTFEQAELKRVYLLMEYIKGKNLEVLRNEQLAKRFPLQLLLTL
jgi:eukaryotic-like serine/threonine-protein kinase